MDLIGHAKMLTDAAAVGVDSMLHVVADTTEMDSMQVQSILVALSIIVRRMWFCVGSKRLIQTLALRVQALQVLWEPPA